MRQKPNSVGPPVGCAFELLPGLGGTAVAQPPRMERGDSDASKGLKTLRAVYDLNGLTAAGRAAMVGQASLGAGQMRKADASSRLQEVTLVTLSFESSGSDEANDHAVLPVL